MFEQNKKLLIGAGAVALAWVIAYYVLVQGNWERAEAAKATAASEVAAWEKSSFQTGKEKDSGRELLKKPDGEAEIKKSDEALDKNLLELKKFEFYSKSNKSSLTKYTAPAIGNSDPNNYFATQLKNSVANAAGVGVTVPSDLSIDKTADDPVPLNLMRLALVDRFVQACRDAGIKQVLKLQYATPQLIVVPEKIDKNAEKSAKSKPKEAKGKEDEEITIDRLVQVPMKVQIRAPEKNFGQLLFELQKPTVAANGYLAVRGYHVAVQDASSGLVEAAVAVSALIRESEIHALKIPVKDPSVPGGGTTTKPAILDRGDSDY